MRRQVRSSVSAGRQLGQGLPAPRSLSASSPSCPRWALPGLDPHLARDRHHWRGPKTDVPPAVQLYDGVASRVASSPTARQPCGGPTAIARLSERRQSRIAALVIRVAADEGREETPARTGEWTMSRAVWNGAVIAESDSTAVLRGNPSAAARRVAGHMAFWRRMCIERPGPAAGGDTQERRLLRRLVTGGGGR